MAQVPPQKVPEAPKEIPKEYAKLDEMKAQVAEAARELYKRGLVNPGEGNVSMRIGRLEEMLITPSYNQYETIKPEDIVHIKFDGTKITAGRPASTEYKLHAAFYNDRRRAKCVIHTHSPYASVLSVLKKNIPVLMEEMVAFLGGEVICADFGAAHTDDLPKNALLAMGDNNACMLANHGVVVVGADLEYTVNIATLTEKMAMMYWSAIQVGEPNTIPPEKQIKFKEYFEARATYSKKKTGTSPPCINPASPEPPKKP